MNRYLVHVSQRHLFELEAVVGQRVRLSRKFSDVDMCNYPSNWQDLRGTLVDIEDAGDGWSYEFVVWDGRESANDFLRGCCTPL